MNKKDEALKLARDWINANGRYDRAAAILTVIDLALADSALERMAENERELGLDYMEPAIKQDLTPEQPAQQGCVRCNTPKKCALHGCSPLTWPAEQPAQQCNHCNGSGRMVRDPDIGTDQECFVCEGAGYIEPEQPAPPPECKTEAEKTAFAFGWWKALEENRKQAAQQQEPVGSLSVRYHRGCKSMTNTDFDYYGDLPEGDHELYTSPPIEATPLASQSRSDVKPLTDAQIGAVAADIWGSVLIAPQSYQAFARAIEAAHGIKENT